ncbi:MAG: site-specific DNA-methyltransferase [Methanobacteriota archaeon]|nr:MAG: site-specific DNA-methyltransferase [Euryarchaeota archaeon]
MGVAALDPRTDLFPNVKGWDALRDYDLEATTLWDFPAQSPGTTEFGDHRFNGVTPSPLVMNLVRRYTRTGDLVVDAMAGSGTALDVARALGRRALAFDLAPRRPDIVRNDARRLPLPDESVDLHFVDPPYSDNVRYSDDPACVGRLPCGEDAFLESLEAVARELHRTLKPGRVLGWLISDEYRRGRFTPVGFLTFEMLGKYFEPVDVISVARHHDRSGNPMWEHRARRYGFYLRGFKYLFIVRKPSTQVLEGRFE